METQNNTFYVYEHWRPDTNVCFYVGKGKKNRAFYLRQRNKHHTSVVSKLISMGFTVDVRIIKSQLTEKEALKLEMERINLYGMSSLTNFTLGGEGTSGLIHSEETRKKMSISQRKRAPRPPYSEEARKKIGLKSIGNSYRKGKTHDEKTKKVLSEYGHKNILLFKKYQSLGPKAISKKVICLNDGKEFDSASEASRFYNVSKSALIELCLGKNYRKSVGGLVFKYKESA
jgi:NUMOD3 motif